MKNKYSVKLFISLILLLSTLLFLSCKKENTESSLVEDIDGNVYKTVQIGTQVWMAENLKVSRYRNGDSIPNIKEITQWRNLVTGAYCDYNNESANSVTYGRLYNWFTLTDSRNIAPTGWHVPTITELKTLDDYLGGSTIAGGKLKETGTIHWNSPNTGATDESGFSALPAGARFGNGLFSDIGNFIVLWASTEHSTTYGSAYRIDYNSNVSILGYGTKQNGLSVRCLKD
jgi:uncharacterized protein (TIGR02145 family)